MPLTTPAGRRPGPAPRRRRGLGRLLAAAALTVAAVALPAVGPALAGAPAAAPTRTATPVTTPVTTGATTGATTAHPAGASAAGAVPAGSAGTSGSSAAAVAVDDEDVTVTLQSVSPQVAGPGDTVRVRARVTNPTATPLEGATAELGVGWRPLVTRSALATWADGDTTRLATAQERLDLPTVPAGGQVDVDLEVAVDGLGLDGAARGPREMSVAVRDAGAVVAAARTFLVWDPARGTADDGAGSSAAAADAGSVRLSLLAPVTGPAVDPEDGSTVEDLAALVAPDGRLSRELDAVDAAESASGTRGALSLAVDPALVAAASGSSDAPVADWAARASGMGEATDVHPLPAYDPDLAALAHAGLSPGSLASFVSTPLPGGGDVPEDWAQPLAWPGGDSAPDLETLGAARSAGLDVAVVPDGYEAVRGTASGLAAMQTPGGRLRAIVADGPLSDALTAGTDTADGTLAASPATTTQRLLAETAVVANQYDDEETPHVVAVLPRGWDPDLQALRSALAALRASGWATVAPLGELLADQAPAVDRVALDDDERQEGELGAAAVQRLDGARQALADFASAAADPSELAGARGAVVAPLAVAYRSSADDRATAVDAALARADTQRAGLSVVHRSDVTLISAAGDIPVLVRNDLSTDVTVSVVLQPEDGRLTVDSRPTTTIPAGASGEVRVPVSAIGSGDVDVEVRLLTPDGTVAAEPWSFQIRVRAGWETVGTAVVAGVVGVLFVAGIWRTVRRGRSPRRTTGEHVPTPDAAA
ncbi:DUF6049 family protein [Puerhibacterium puerhi]|uniref:DUF6049 family protein n=1 Tax=Puerhibacterium puerhi TaxID=2692623 RepID=UPI00135A8198|nr:DUF6049 family protein [Puerhibacterium puerhi]